MRAHGRTARQEEDNTSTDGDTYQNKLNSQSYRRLKIPTMTGRPRQSRRVEVRSVLGELEATSKAASEELGKRCLAARTVAGWLADLTWGVRLWRREEALWSQVREPLPCCCCAEMGDFLGWETDA